MTLGHLLCKDGACTVLTCPFARLMVDKHYWMDGESKLVHLWFKRARSDHMMHGGCQAGTKIPDWLLFFASLSFFSRKESDRAVIVYHASLSAPQAFLELRECAHCAKLAI